MITLGITRQWLYLWMSFNRGSRSIVLRMQMVTPIGQIRYKNLHRFLSLITALILPDMTFQKWGECQARWHMPAVSTLRRLRQKNGCDFETSLGYRVIQGQPELHS